MTRFLASSLKLLRDSQHENFCFCSQSFIHTLYYSRKKSPKGFPQLQKYYSVVLYLLWGQLNMLFHCFAFFFISIRIFPFFLAPFTTKRSGLKFLIIQIIEFLFLVTYSNKDLMGSERGSVRTVSGCLLFTVSESELSCEPPRGRLILGIYAKASVGLVMDQSHFSQCLEGSERDSFCVSCSLSLSKE